MNKDWNRMRIIYVLVCCVMLIGFSGCDVGRSVSVSDFGQDKSGYQEESRSEAKEERKLDGKEAHTSETKEGSPSETQQESPSEIKKVSQKHIRA